MLSVPVPLPVANGNIEEAAAPGWQAIATGNISFGQHNAIAVTLLDEGRWLFKLSTSDLFSLLDFQGLPRTNGWRSVCNSPPSRIIELKLAPCFGVPQNSAISNSFCRS
jgi:hypothetical protein